jgi:very-short-patch-repair endonuclease
VDELKVEMATQTQARLREWALQEQALRQHGVATHRDLLEIGFKHGAIKRRVEAKRLHRVHQGVYAVGRPGLERRGRWLAAVLAYGVGAVLSHRSAAVHWGLTRREPAGVDVTARQGRAGRPGIIFHRCQLEPADVTHHDAIPVTTPTRTLFDLSEVVDENALRGACEEADRLGMLELKELERIVERGWGRHALKPIRPILADARHADDPGSPLEDKFSSFCREQRLPKPSTNVTVLSFKVDALWPAQRLVVELDSVAFHSHRSAFESDRARDAALLVAGYRVIRITDRRLRNEPASVAAQIRQLLGRR